MNGTLNISRIRVLIGVIAVAVLGALLISPAAAKSASRSLSIKAPSLSATASNLAAAANGRQDAESAGQEAEHAGQDAEHADDHGPIPPVWMVLPFIAILILIATGPLFFPRHWHHYYPYYSVSLGVFVAIYYVFVLNSSLPVEHAII